MSLRTKYNLFEHSAVDLLKKLKEFVDNGEKLDKYVVSNLMSQLEYSLNILLGEIFLDDVEEIFDESRLNRAAYYLGHVIRRLDGNRDEAVFWIKSGPFRIDTHFVGGSADYKIVGDMILARMNEMCDDGEYIQNLMFYLNDRMAADDWRD
jgi:hypothetical protein